MQARRRRTGSESEPLIVVDQYTKSPERYQYIQQQSNNVQDYYIQEDLVEDYTEPEPIMTARDRTGEFANTIQSLQGRNIARAVTVKDAKKSRIIQSHTEFMMIAKSIGRNIASTYTKLEKLTLRMNLFLCLFFVTCYRINLFSSG